MQLDKTRIVVRERTVLEIMDLALHVLRDYLSPLAWALILGVLPFALLNVWLVDWMVDAHYQNESTLPDPWGMLWNMAPWRYIWNMSLLVFFEAPLATSFVTAYLGQAVFVERPSLRHVVTDVFRMAPRVLWCQMVLRGVALAWLLLWGAQSETETWACEFFLSLLACVIAMYRTGRPFINEIILLERNRVFAHGSNTMTIGRRSSLLHSMVVGDLVIQYLAALFVSIALTGVFAYSIYLTVAAATNDYTWGPVMTYFGIPFALWFTAGFMAVVRFLNYLDSRIRQEGWEVELRLRAEAARLASRLA